MRYYEFFITQTNRSIFDSILYLHRIIFNKSKQEMLKTYFLGAKKETFNLGQNICRLFHLLAQFFFTTSETELDFYHQKVSARIASRVAERLKT